MAFTEKQLRKLSRIKGRATLYEVALVRADGTKVLLAYTNRTSKEGIMSAISQRALAVIAFIGHGLIDMRMYPKRGTKDIAMDGGATVTLTGRTQRDAIIDGELDSIRKFEPPLAEV